jgi:hypothetical protein
VRPGEHLVKGDQSFPKTERARLLRRGLALMAMSVAWNVLEGAVALGQLVSQVLRTPKSCWLILRFLLAVAL